MTEENTQQDTPDQPEANDGGDPDTETTTEPRPGNVPQTPGVFPLGENEMMIAAPGMRLLIDTRVCRSKTERLIGVDALKSKLMGL